MMKSTPVVHGWGTDSYGKDILSRSYSGHGVRSYRHLPVMIGR